MMSGNVLMVTTHCEVVNQLQFFLKKEEIEHIKVIHNGYQALQWLKSEKPDLVVIDNKLPDIDGIEICKEIRKKSAIPIFFLSTEKESDVIITSYKVGINDYIIKPYDASILAAKIYANLQQRNKFANRNKSSLNKLKFGHLEIDVDGYTVSVNGKPVNLITKELQILLLLCQNPNKVFSPEKLYKTIWGLECLGDARTVMVHISNLRKKIEVEPTKPKFIRTIRGFGYKFHLPES